MYYVIKQGNRTMSILLGSLNRTNKGDKSKFWGMLQDFGFRGSISEEWKRYVSESSAYKKKNK